MRMHMQIVCGVQHRLLDLQFSSHFSFRLPKRGPVSVEGAEGGARYEEPRFLARRCTAQGNTGRQGRRCTEHVAQAVHAVTAFQPLGLGHPWAQKLEPILGVQDANGSVQYRPDAGGLERGGHDH